MLADYDLVLVSISPVSEEPSDDGHDLNALSPIALPLRDPESKHFPEAYTETTDLYEYRPAHAVATISPKVFNLPSNADRRFSSLIKTYHLDAVENSDTEILPATRIAGAQVEKETAKATGSSADELESGAAKPRWMLWNECCQ